MFTESSFFVIGFGATFLRLSVCDVSPITDAIQFVALHRSLVDVKISEHNRNSATSGQNMSVRLCFFFFPFLFGQANKQGNKFMPGCILTVCCSRLANMFAMSVKANNLHGVTNTFAGKKKQRVEFQTNTLRSSTSVEGEVVRVPHFSQFFLAGLDYLLFGLACWRFWVQYSSSGLRVRNVGGKVECSEPGVDRQGGGGKEVEDVEGGQQISDSQRAVMNDWRDWRGRGAAQGVSSWAEDDPASRCDDGRACPFSGNTRGKRRAYSSQLAPQIIFRFTALTAAEIQLD